MGDANKSEGNPYAAEDVTGGPEATAARRRVKFAPWHVVWTGSHFLVVDNFQPVAVCLTPSGHTCDIVSWAAQVPPPRVSGWPNRRVSPIPDGLLVQDLPDGVVVAVAMNSGGHLEVATVAANVELPEQWVHRRLFGTANRSVPVGDADEGAWQVESTRDRFSWSASVALTNRGGTVARLAIPRPASITSLAAVTPELAAVCVQRADARPWQFRPDAQVWIISAHTGQLRPTVISPLDITMLGWSIPHSDEDTLRRHRELAVYMEYSLSQWRAVQRRGARDAEVTTHGDLDSADVTIDLTFTLPHLPRVRFRRRDRPFDERGALHGGLRDLNISIGEDLDAGLIEALGPHGPGIHDV